ncbi:MAG TPA: hypothetical protein EYN96_05980, partial [Candidatus Hydrogenedentes bacterium]|nr:hypothetical protein [Candidatus Hydrogenedentota bacterium]
MPSWLNDIFAPLTDLQNHPEMLHAAAIHLPLALAILGFPLALLAIIPWKHERAVRVTAIASYLTLLLAATLAVNSGENVHTLLPSTLPEYIWDDINSHESLARKVWIGAFVTTLFLVISLTPVKKIALSSTLVAAVGAAVTLAIVIQVGHQGGKLVYEHGLGTPPLYVEVHQLAQSKPAQSIPVKSTNTVDTIAEELEPVTYAANIQPILQEYCYGCHSSKERKGELDLSTLDGILAGGEKDGPPIVFGNPDASPLIDYVRGKRQPQMPKDEPPLNNNHISLMERWILTSTPETIRSEIIASNGDPGAVKDLYDAVDRKSAPAIDQLAKLTRTRPNPLFNFDISRLEKRSVFLAQRGKKKLDPLVETTEKEAHISELESSQKEKLGQLNAPRSELKKNYERIFSEDGTVIWPNPEYLKLLKILRLDVLSERVTPPANATPSTV